MQTPKIGGRYKRLADGNVVPVASVPPTKHTPTESEPHPTPPATTAEGEGNDTPQEAN